LALDERSAVLLMTHDYARDGEALRALWPTPAFYIGLMGARQRGAQLLAESGHTPDAARARGVFAPVGLDVGGESPESVALAVLAEIQAALAGRDGGHLRDKPGPIHRLAAELPADTVRD
jgi:xanthine dehydrogenase accessory factor